MALADRGGGYRPMRNYGGRASAAGTKGQLIDFECTIEGDTPVVRLVLDGGFKTISIPNEEFVEVLVQLSEWLHPDLPGRMVRYRGGISGE